MPVRNPRATMAVPPIDLDKRAWTSLRMNPLTLPDAQYREVFERVTQLALQYLASLAESPFFPVVSASSLGAGIVNHRMTVADVEQIVSEVTEVGRELTRTLLHRL
jgi:hypothetical protein